jgi:hypothetical protein
VNQDDGWASLFFVAKISSGCRDLFRPHGDYMKGCYVLTMLDTYGLGPYVDRAWNTCGALVGYSPVGCTSIRIAATLGYEYHLFVVARTKIVNGLMFIIELCYALL